MSEKEFFEWGDTVCVVLFVVAIAAFIVIEYNLF